MLSKVMGRHHVLLQRYNGQFKLLPRNNPWFSSIEALKELPIDGADPYTIIINQLVSSISVDFLHNIMSIPFWSELIACTMSCDDRSSNDKD